MKHILEAFRPSVVAAYARLRQDTEAAERLKDEDKRVKAHRAARGRCGATIGAASKAARRTLLLDGLATAKAAGLDVTPSTVQHLSQALLGRGVSTRAAARAFATPGRTAATKTALSLDDLAELRERLEAELATLDAALREEVFVEARAFAEEMGCDWVEPKRKRPASDLKTYIPQAPSQGDVREKPMLAPYKLNALPSGGKPKK